MQTVATIVLLLAGVLCIDITASFAIAT